MLEHLLQARPIKADDELAVDLSYRHPLLASPLYHVHRRFLIHRNILFIERDTSL